MKLAIDNRDKDDKLGVELAKILEGRDRGN